MAITRNLSVEFLRICMMFGIVLLHVITQGGYLDAGGVLTRKFINILSPCVAGFVFISGYFGIKFTVKKFLRLWALLLFYTIFFCLPYGSQSFLYHITNNWFLYAYFVLMTLSPVINSALEGANSQQILSRGLPIVITVYGWSYLCVIPYVKEYIPVPLGFAPLSFFTMLGIYTAARMFKLLNIEERLKRGKPWMIVSVFLISVLMVVLGFHHHNSPFSLIVVALMFFIVKNWLPIEVHGAKLINLVAPSMFAVYLIHSTASGHVFFKWFLSYLIEVIGLSVFTAYFVSAVVVFILCVNIDLVRRKMYEMLKFLFSARRTV